jgi:hypothetical protein
MLLSSTKFPQGPETYNVQWLGPRHHRALALQNQSNAPAPVSQMHPLCYHAPPLLPVPPFLVIAYINSSSRIRLVGEEETESISHEINLFIKARVQEIGSQLNLEDSVRSALENLLLNIEHRTYLWLKLIFEVIYSRLDVTTEKRIRRIVDTIPDTVEKA